MATDLKELMNEEVKETTENQKEESTAPKSTMPAIKLESFEGPLDLLLHLIRKNKMDIFDIPISEITKQYMKIITSSRLKEVNLELAGEYLLMASTLAQIKSKMLLPVDDDEDISGEDDFEKDPRSELVTKLLEFQRYKEAAGKIYEIPRLNENVFPSGHKHHDISIDDNKDPENPSVSTDQIDIFTLLSYYDKLISKLPDVEPHQIEDEHITVSQKIMEIINKLKTSERGTFAMSELFTVLTRAEIIVTFLSLLELTRLKQVSLHQSDPESDIWIRRKFTESSLDLSELSYIEATYSSQNTSDPETENEESTDGTRQNEEHRTEPGTEPTTRTSESAPDS